MTEEYIDKIQDNSHMTWRGYTIPKNILTQEDLEDLRKCLSISPIEGFGMKRAPNQKSSKILLMRENEKKIYIPRFFGVARYGNPVNWDLSDGENIKVPFIKPIRDYQENIVNTYIDYVKNDEELGNGGILEVPCGRGKTVMALAICSRLGKKTLIIVHKEFLMNQWIERIQEFMPTAKVGVIQGKKFEIEGNDIVIGMIQTMYDRVYDPNTFGSFGLTIIDEVHRIGSEEFSKTLGKVCTPYMLGISATVDRKDGLTEIIYMYIGNKIYSEERDSTDGVQVRSIQFDYIDQFDHKHDAEYNEIEYDYRGNIKFATMINKICAFPPRRRFLVKVLSDLIDEDSEKQIMVLCHKRDVLCYLQEEIDKIGFATCGLYVGGMKKEALQDTESKQIVLATYAMAAEALDIKTLNTLVMVTPKTDIVQSVGRILRTKSDSKIIVDIVDSHDVFQNQWKKRRAFYRKSDYDIKMIKNDTYKDMSDMSLWKSVKEKNGSKKQTKCLIEIPDSLSDNQLI